LITNIISSSGIFLNVYHLIAFDTYNTLMLVSILSTLRMLIGQICQLILIVLTILVNFKIVLTPSQFFSTFYSILYNGPKESVPIRKSNSLFCSHAFYAYKIRKLLRTKAQRWRSQNRFKTTESLRKI